MNPALPPDGGRRRPWGLWVAGTVYLLWLVWLVAAVLVHKLS
jgi:hypothetical protein